MEHSINIGLDSTSPIECDSCGHLFFGQGVHLRRVSSLLSGTGKPGIIPIPVFYCLACNHVNNEFLPQGISNLKNDV